MEGLMRNKWCRFLRKLGIIRVIMEQDQKKVDAIIKSLKDSTGDEWDEAVGFFVVPSVTYNGSIPNFNLNNGMIQKTFINIKTGEVKYFWIDKIKK